MNKEKKYLMEKCRLPTKATPRVSRKQPVCGNSEGNTCGSGHLVQIDLQGATFEPGAVVELHAFIRLLGTRVANETAAPRLAILLLDFGELDLARLLELLLEFARVPREWNLSRKKRKFHLCHLFYSGKKELNSIHGIEIQKNKNFETSLKIFFNFSYNFQTQKFFVSIFLFLYKNI